jgi:hypothetical protein
MVGTEAIVIPGHREAMSPESITPVPAFNAELCYREYGFGLAQTRAPE